MIVLFPFNKYASHITGTLLAGILLLFVQKNPDNTCVLDTLCPLIDPTLMEVQLLQWIYIAKSVDAVIIAPFLFVERCIEPNYLLTLHPNLHTDLLHFVTLLLSQIAETVGSTTIRNRYGTFLVDRYLIDIDSTVFTIWDVTCILWTPVIHLFTFFVFYSIHWLWVSRVIASKVCINPASIHIEIQQNATK